MRIPAVGAVTDRPGLAKALDHLRAGDALAVWKLDRIGRSLKHVVELVDGLQQQGIGLKVLTGGIDTTSSTGRLVFGFFDTLAEFERGLIKERTMAGLVAARARGRVGGRPRLMTRAKLRTAMTMMGERSNAATDVAEQLGISLSTPYVYVYVDGTGQAKPRARKLHVPAGRRHPPPVPAAPAACKSGTAPSQPGILAFRPHFPPALADAPN